MSIRHYVSLGFILLFCSHLAYAGGWSSGGGELSRDGGNPWFLANTSSVSYCIEIDEENFGQNRETSSKIISRVFENWKKQFKLSIIPQPGPDLCVATQTFTETSCSKNPDITFQLGTLTGEQIKNIEDPKRYLGISVRTDYDREKLKGKGFIYISPSKGPLKYEGDNVVDKPWSLGDGGLLYMVLLHEVGHVFGLPHSAEPFSPMNQRYIEDQITDGVAQQAIGIWKHYPLPVLFGYSSDPISYTACRKGVNNRFYEFFGITSRPACSGFTFNNGHLEVFTRVTTSESNPNLLIGTGTYDRTDGLADQEPAMTIWLPKEQKVFPQLLLQKLIAGPKRQKVSRYTGTFTSSDKKISRSFFILTTPGGRSVFGGVMNGKLYTDLDQGI